jgi:uncharacterized protein YjiS (DUF1127 family)
MSHFLCHAVVARAHFEPGQPMTEMQFEQDMMEAKGAELARQARRQRISHLAGKVTSAWTRTLDRLARPRREADARKDLQKKLENMPSYMLKDIGVTRDQVGRFCHYNDYGMLVELVPGKPEAPEAKEKSYEVTGQLVRAAV